MSRIEDGWQYVEGQWRNQVNLFTKQHYERFVKLIGVINDNLPADMSADMREQVTAMVTARVAHMCSDDSSRFDSFRFADRVRQQVAETKASGAG